MDTSQIEAEIKKLKDLLKEKRALLASNENTIVPMVPLFRENSLHQPCIDAIQEAHWDLKDKLLKTKIDTRREMLERFTRTVETRKA